MAKDDNFKLIGEKELARDFARMEREFPDAIEEATMDAVLFVHQEIPDYPAANPGSTYRRTGTLGRTITTLLGAMADALSRVKVQGNKFIGLVGSSLDYAGYVIDESDYFNTLARLETIVQQNQHRVHPKSGRRRAAH